MCCPSLGPSPSANVLHGAAAVRGRALELPGLDHSLHEPQLPGQGNGPSTGLRQNGREGEPERAWKATRTPVGSLKGRVSVGRSARAPRLHPH